MLCGRAGRARADSMSYARLEIEDFLHAVASPAAEVVGRRRHRRHLRFPLLIDLAARKFGDRALVIVALDVVEEVEPVAKDDVLRDADLAHAFEHLGPDRTVVLLVAILDARLQASVQPDLHRLNSQDWRREFSTGAWPARSEGGGWVV